MKKIAIILLLLLAIILNGCFSDFYTPYIDARSLDYIKTLDRKSKPKIIYSTNIDNDIAETIKSNHYICIGRTRLNISENSDFNDIIPYKYQT